MNLDLKGKMAVVCGSSKGIGKAAAIELAALGATVTLLARNEQQLKEVLTSLSSQAGQRHGYFTCDLSSPDQVRELTRHGLKEGDYHILINNTGGPPAGKAIDAHPDDFVNAFNSHLVCGQILVQHLATGMKASGYGRIINVISTSVKMPISGLGVSNTIRGAVANWAKTLSVELAPFGITVNNVLPGSTKTDRLFALIKSKAAQRGISNEEVELEMKHEVPAGRFGEPQELGAAIAFLASPAASYINGINLPVDGGRTGSL